MSKPVELYTVPGCPYSAAARECVRRRPGWRGRLRERIVASLRALADAAAAFRCGE